MRPASLAILFFICTPSCLAATSAGAGYLGTRVAALSELHHGVKGEVYAVDARTLYIKDFYYDGQGPAAYFYVGKGPTIGVGGVRVRDERGGTSPLRKYRGEGVALALPDDVTVQDVKWFTVWCDEYSVNFGSVEFPPGLKVPRPARVGALRGVHGVSSDPIVVVDAQTLLLPNFSYDGEAPDAKFWVGRGDKPSSNGIRIPDENGKEAPLRKYSKKTIVLTLPGDLTVFDIGHFGVWCEAFTVDFGHVTLPHDQLAAVPPSLKMLGVSPQSKLNCEVLQDELAFEVRWAVAGDSIVMQLVAKLEDGEYMSFGISGSNSHSQMVGADVAVAWVDKKSLQGFAVDYYLDAKSQCAGVRGSCPDERLGEKTNSIRLLNAALVNGYSIVTYQRALRATDELDRPVLTNTSQPIVWALGPLNSRNEVSYHHHFTKGDKFIEFGRPPVWNCPMPESEDEHRDVTERITTRTQTHSQTHTQHERKPERKPVEKVVVTPAPPAPAPAPRATPWEIPAVACYEPPDGVFYAQMGPTGGKQGYPAITGHVGWGISWYINGLLIPEINVVRGRRYTFVVEGGLDPDQPARYHPFYITNDPVGGYYHKSEQEKKGVEIYAGVRRQRNGDLIPTGVGRLCNWTPDENAPDADDFPSFGAYQRSLTLVCEEGSPGVVTWTPDRNTPDTVYYQCFTHRYLGWKINVLDSCDESESSESEASESRVSAVIAPPDASEPLQSAESIQVHHRVAPDSNFINQRRKTEKIINTKTNYNGFSSDKEPEPISKGQIRDVIEAVEDLESRMRENMKKNITESRPHDRRPIHHHRIQHHHRPQSYNNQAGPHDKTMRPQDNSMGHHDNRMRQHDNRMGQHDNRQGQHDNRMGPNDNRMGPNDNRMGPNDNRMGQHDNRINQQPDKKDGQQHDNRPTQNQDNIVPPSRSNTQYQENRHTQYQVYENPEEAINHPPEAYFLPANHSPPLTLQALRPGSSSSPHRRPLPPRPPLLTHHRHFGYPLPLPATPHHIITRKPYRTLNRPRPLPPMLPPPPSVAPHNIMIHNMPPPQPTHTQTLSLGRTDLIANQVVKSQITLPGAIDSVGQASLQQSFATPGQIILGKPMDNPVPLDQQMLPGKHHIVRVTPQHEIPSTTPRERTLITPAQDLQQNEIKSSDFIGESPETSTLLPAVNTGFKPNTIVIESGFKPIIRERLMERNDEYDDDTPVISRREDTNIEEDYDQSPQYISNHAYQMPSDKLTESFEPMFIPSPEDHLLPANAFILTDIPKETTTKKAHTKHITKEVFPSNHAKEDRPHPVYVKKDSDVSALFSKKNLDKEITSDLAMESDRVSPQYLPPDPNLPKEHSQKLSNEETFTTYDGKTVSAVTLTGVPDEKPAKIFSSKLPSNSELLLKTPQFGPFKGDLPPLGDTVLLKKDDSPPPSDSRTTNLKLVNVFQDPDDDELKAEGSEVHSVTEKELKEHEQNVEYDYQEDVDDMKKRERRETKATQFEKSETEDHITPVHQSETKNHVDFVSDLQLNSSTRHVISHLLLLALVLRLL